MPSGANIFAFVAQVIVLVIFVAPIIIGFTFVRTDANRQGQPGILWALITIPLGWLAILAYLIVRALGTRPRPQQ